MTWDGALMIVFLSCVTFFLSAIISWAFKRKCPDRVPLLVVLVFCLVWQIGCYGLHVAPYNVFR